MNTYWYTDYWGDDWEEICNILLGLKHGVDYEPISDTGGDNGLDGLVVSNGTAYQAYGQEPENKDPVKGVKDKIHKDLTKLKTFESDIAEILKNNKISRWVLLLNKAVPHNDIHAFTKKKQEQVKSWELPILTSNFQAIVQPPSYLQSEYNEYKKKKYDRIEVEIEAGIPPSFDSIKEESSFINVSNKFKKITDIKSAEILAYNEIKAHIENTSQFDEIRKQQPDFYSEIEEIRSDVESDAEQGSILEGSYNSFANTRFILESRLNNKIGERLGSSTLKRVRKFIISDWFVRCPLDFKDKDSEPK